MNYECEICTEVDFHGETLFGNYYCAECSQETRKDQNVDLFSRLMGMDKAELDRFGTRFTVPSLSTEVRDETDTA